MIHILGKPIYKVGDTVSFNYTIDDQEVVLTGTVEIVDSFGTFEQHSEVSYNVLVENWKDSGMPCLVKHIRESGIKQ